MIESRISMTDCLLPQSIDCILHQVAPMSICTFLPCLDESPVCNTEEKQNPKFYCILLTSLNILLLNLSETLGRYHQSRNKFLLLELDTFEAKT